MRKVLIITYYWPPSGGGGVQRWLKFSKYLPEFGWEPIIFTPDNPDFHTKDESLQKDISDDLEVIRFPIWEPYTLFDKASGKSNNKREQGIVENSSGNSLLSNLGKWIRGNIFIPDPKVFWVRPSFNFLKDLIVERNINFIITTGPPHSMHLIGLKLKRKTGVKWVSDFRDPWVRWDILKEFHISWLSKNAHKRLEKAVMRNADRIISVSDTWAHEIELDHAIKPVVITNGFDTGDFQGKPYQRSEKFILSHTGLINKFRNPTGLWEAISQLCEERKEIADSLQLKFSGMLDKNVFDTIQSYSYLQPRFSFLKYLSHEDALDQYKSSSVLLLLLNQSENGRGHLPGKLFEYLAAKRHILALGDVNGDASKIIRETQTGVICNPDDTASIKMALDSFFTHYKNLNFPSPINLEQYSRPSLTKKLADVLDEL